MIWIFGTRHCGKVDHLPGLFYVTSSFFHIQFVPLIPTGSVLLLDDGSERGVQVGMSGKSVLFAYLRAACILGGIGLIIAGVLFFSNQEILPAIVLIAMGVAGVVFFFATFKLARPSPDRALHLAEQIGIPPELVAQYFVQNNIPLPEDFDDRYGGVQEVEAVDDREEYDARGNESRRRYYD